MTTTTHYAIRAKPAQRGRAGAPASRLRAPAERANLVAAVRSIAYVLVWDVRCWLRRYLPAEIVGLVTTLACATFANMLASNDVMLVVLSAYSGGASYYVVLLSREVIDHRHAQLGLGMTYTWRSALATVRNLALEFGSAELLDSLLFSPLLMYVCIRTVPNLQLAIVLGEVASTTAFYTTTMIAHGLRKLWI